MNDYYRHLKIVFTNCLWLNNLQDVISLTGKNSTYTDYYHRFSYNMEVNKKIAEDIGMYNSIFKNTLEYNKKHLICAIIAYSILTNPLATEKSNIKKIVSFDNSYDIIVKVIEHIFTCYGNVLTENYVIHIDPCLKIVLKNFFDNISNKKSTTAIHELAAELETLVN